MSRMGSMATGDGVYTWRLHFQDRDGKDQRKTEMQTLRVNKALGYETRNQGINSNFEVQGRCHQKFKRGYQWPHKKGLVSYKN